MEPNVSVVTYVALSEALDRRIPIFSGVRTMQRVVGYPRLSSFDRSRRFSRNGCRHFRADVGIRGSLHRRGRTMHQASEL